MYLKQSQKVCCLLCYHRGKTTATSFFYGAIQHLVVKHIINSLNSFYYFYTLFSSICINFIRVRSVHCLDKHTVCISSHFRLQKSQNKSNLNFCLSEKGNFLCAFDGKTGAISMTLFS